VRDPRGHSYGAPAEAEQLDAEHWSSCQAYLVAVDLFNHGYYWESHEELERLWRGTGRRTETGVFLQGLIQVAAALLKRSMGEPGSASRLAAQGCTKLRTIADVHLGISGPGLARVIEATLEGQASGPVTIRLQGLECLPGHARRRAPA
jgi:predicted metal-dependent hydrolase